jgi:ubiquinone/menaquinone biosynthesis C-methylase UbiE
MPYHLAMDLRRQARDWNDLAEMDPMWAILSVPGKRYGRWDVDEFLASGQRQIQAMMKTAESLGYPRRREAALDFGCGVGRGTRALADVFDECVGVDVSLEMIEQARHLSSDKANCSFVVNTADNLAFARDGAFDLVYSYIVLQHLPSRSAIETYVREMIRVLRPGGLLVFQVPSDIATRHRLQPRRRLWTMLRALHVSKRYLYRTLGLCPIRMISVSEPEVRSLLQEERATLLRVDARTEEGGRWQDRTYWVTRE